jgi:hypothetical protein
MVSPKELLAFFSLFDVVDFPKFHREEPAAKGDNSLVLNPTRSTRA